ncbi:hypothetical protein KR093_010783, partial [Drosophila rubida]
KVANMVVSPIYEAVNILLAKSRPKHRHLNEQVQLHVLLKNYDLENDAPFSGSIRLSHMIFPGLKVCVLGDEKHCDEAEENSIHCMNAPSVHNFYKFRTDVKKLAWSYDVFLASQSVMEALPYLFGPHLDRLGKTPVMLGHDQPLPSKIEELKSTVKFELKKSLKLCAVVGHVRMTPEQLNDNVATSLRFLATLLKDNWSNIQSAHIKTAKGQPCLIY